MRSLFNRRFFRNAVWPHLHPFVWASAVVIAIALVYNVAYYVFDKCNLVIPGGNCMSRECVVRGTIAVTFGAIFTIVVVGYCIIMFVVAGVEVTQEQLNAGKPFRDTPCGAVAMIFAVLIALFVPLFICGYFRVFNNDRFLSGLLTLGYAAAFVACLGIAYGLYTYATYVRDDIQEKWLQEIVVEQEKGV
jgi:hypothetical protein